MLVEGEADAGLVRRCLGRHCGARWVADRPIDLPTPFGARALPGEARASREGRSLILNWQARVTPSDQNLQETSRGGRDPTFDCVLRVPSPSDDTLYIIVRLGGDKNFPPDGIELIDLIGRNIDLPGRPHDVHRFAVACFFDADAPEHDGSSTAADCVTARQAWFLAALQARFATAITPSHAQWAKIREAQLTRWAPTALMPLGLYVFHDSSTQQGTVEDILEPIVSQHHPTRLTDAHAYLQTHPNPASTRAVDRAKARLTIALQPTRPGFSLATWTQGGVKPEDKPLPDTAFAGPECKAIADFLTAVPW